MGLRQDINQFLETRPTFVRPPTTNTFAQLQQQLAGVGDPLRQEAARLAQPGLSPFARLQQSQAAQQAASGVAQQQGALASAGGLRSGAAERLQVAGGQNLLNVNAGIAAQDQFGRQRNRFALLQGQTTADLNRARLLGGAATSDAARAFNQAQAENVFNLQDFRTRAGVFGAERQAQEIENQGGGNLLNLDLGLGNFLDPSEGVFGGGVIGGAANVATSPFQLPFKAFDAIF